MIPLPNLTFAAGTASNGDINAQNNLGSGSGGAWPFSGSADLWKYAAIGLVALGAFYMWKRHRR